MRADAVRGRHRGAAEERESGRLGTHQEAAAGEHRSLVVVTGALIAQLLQTHEKRRRRGVAVAVGHEGANCNATRAPYDAPYLDVPMDAEELVAQLRHLVDFGEELVVEDEVLQERRLAFVEVGRPSCEQEHARVGDIQLGRYTGLFEAPKERSGRPGNLQNDLKGGVALRFSIDAILLATGLTLQRRPTGYQRRPPQTKSLNYEIALLSRPVPYQIALSTYSPLERKV